MSTHNTVATIDGGKSVVALALDAYTKVSLRADEYRRRITNMAWNKLPNSQKQSLSNATRTLSGGDDDLAAAYSQSVLIIDYVNQRANINTDPAALLPDENYRFWS